MKHIRMFFAIATTLLVLASCKKGFLEEKPHSFISSDALYGTDAGLEAAINGCYSTMSAYGGYGAGYLVLISVGSGGYLSRSAANADLNSLTHGPSTLMLTNNSPWDQFYSAIAIANDIIAKAPLGSASEVVKSKVVGEAHLLRGMLYFNLVRMFGGVPLRTAPTTQKDIYLPRASKDEVYALIIADLEKAKAMMTTTPSIGRPSKYAAGALLGKVYLAMASNAPVTQSPYWEKAKTELLEVVASGAYSLVPNFTTLFTAGNENTKESIIEIQYSLAGGNSEQFCNFFTPGGSNLTPVAATPPFGNIRLNKEIFDRHRTQYPTDPRINVSYVYGSFTKAAGGVTNIYPTVNNPNQGWPYIKKYVDPAFIAGSSNRNFIYLRYADVLLMLAEIENEINGSGAAYVYVNQVLARARNSSTPAAATPADWSGLTQDQFRDRILRERRYELMGELHLYYDVRRKGAEYLKAFFLEHNNHPTFNATADKAYPTDDASVNKLLLFPIPEKEINTNPKMSAADQNPGYN